MLSSISVNFKLCGMMKNYKNQLKCTCGGCMCNPSAEMEMKKEEDRIHQFLLGLYDNIYESCSGNSDQYRSASQHESSVLLGEIS